MTHNNSAADSKDIVIERIFAAPRHLVWAAFTVPAHIEKWFGPEGFATRVEQIDFTVGGKSKYVMIGPDGTEYPSVGVFREVAAFEKIVTTDDFGDEYKASSVDELPQGMVITITFEDIEDKTKVTLRTSHPTVEDRKKHEDMGVVAGWNSSFECLDEHLRGCLENETADREIIIRRLFDAPRDVVFSMWSKPEHLEKWWGPTGFTTTTSEFDFRAGGVWTHVMHGPDGKDYPNFIEYTKIESPSMITYANRGGVDDGRELRFISTVTFEERGDATDVTLQMVFENSEDRDYVKDFYGAVEGGQQTLISLARYIAETQAPYRERLILALPSETEIQFMRIFDAPRELVFQAMTEAEHITRWMYGPEEYSFLECESDPRVGGEFRFVWNGPGDQPMGMSGRYIELEPPERIVHTEIFDEDWTGGETTVTTMLHEEHGTTTMQLTVKYSTQQARDAAYQSPMAEGMSMSYDRLDTVIRQSSKS